MEGYDERTYGDRFVDVYDEWYHGISDVATTVAVLLELADGGPVVELGVGTGRLAVPLAQAGADRRMQVVGVDSSDAMLARLAVRDVGAVVDVRRGDMVRDLPAGPFRLAYVAYNTLFNLLGDGEQAACFGAVAARLEPAGRFVVEAFVPDDPPRTGDVVTVRSLTADRVVLSISRHDPEGERAEGQFVELIHGERVRLRPWAVRYRTPEALDELADAAGFDLEHRWANFERTPFSADAERHVSVYRLR